MQGAGLEKVLAIGFWKEFYRTSEKTEIHEEGDLCQMIYST